MDKQVQVKIAELKESVRKVENTAKDLKKLLKSAEIGDILTIEDVAVILRGNVFHELSNLEEAAHKQVRKFSS